MGDLSSIDQLLSCCEKSLIQDLLKPTLLVGWRVRSVKRLLVLLSTVNGQCENGHVIKTYAGRDTPWTRSDRSFRHGAEVDNTKQVLSFASEGTLRGEKSRVMGVERKCGVVVVEAEEPVTKHRSIIVKVRRQILKRRIVHLECEDRLIFFKLVLYARFLSSKTLG